MTPEERARQLIDARLAQSGWVVQDLKKVNPMASLGVAVRVRFLFIGRKNIRNGKRKRTAAEYQREAASCLLLLREF